MSFWTSLHLGNQGRHGSSQPYDIWPKNFASRSCVVELPRTQGIIEFNNKSVKHITTNSKRGRIDEIVSNLFLPSVPSLANLKFHNLEKELLPPKHLRNAKTI